jgi:hypothetical protein
VIPPPTKPANSNPKIAAMAVTMTVIQIARRNRSRSVEEWRGLKTNSVALLSMTRARA